MCFNQVYFRETRKLGRYFANIETDLKGIKQIKRRQQN